MNIPSSRTPVRPEAGNLLLESKANQLVVRDPNGTISAYGKITARRVR